MADKCAWLIAWGKDVDPAAQLIAGAARQYGLNVKGQHWPENDKQAWLASGIEAAAANTGIVLLVITHSLFAKPEVRRSIALFRLFLQTRVGRHVDGFVMLQGERVDQPHVPSQAVGVLDDWLVLGPTDSWVAKAVARMHAPGKSALPIKFSVYAEERLGVWFELRPTGDGVVQGCTAGLAGNDSKITFHAVGQSGHLPEKSVNEYEIKGMKFEALGHEFDAWGLQNSLASDQSYFIRVDGEPELLANGPLPGGEVTEMDFVRLG